MEAGLAYISTVLLLALIGGTPTASWTPPASPEPHAILREARQDTRAGHYEIALAKFVWFHENALRLEPSLAGVRTSFALSHWNELAQKHPPAMHALRQAREQAAADVLSGRDPRSSFQDVATIDRTLGQEARTRELFERLDREQPDVARDVFSLAQRALVAQKSFELANKYLNPPAEMKRLVERYRAGLRSASGPAQPDHREFARRYFTHNVSTLVALLVVSGQVEEADAVADAARTHTEQFIVEALRKAGALTISLVAEQGGEVVGHVALSPVSVSDGATDWYGLGPISVKPELQRKGIGSLLMQAAIGLLRERDAAGCVLVGDPLYYSRFGFTPEPGLVLPDVPPEYFQALRFGPSLPQGVVTFHAAFSARR